MVKGKEWPCRWGSAEAIVCLLSLLRIQLVLTVSELTNLVLDKGIICDIIQIYIGLSLIPDF